MYGILWDLWSDLSCHWFDSIFKCMYVRYVCTVCMLVCMRYLNDALYFSISWSLLWRHLIFISSRYYLLSWEWRHKVFMYVCMQSYECKVSSVCMYVCRAFHSRVSIIKKMAEQLQAHVITFDYRGFGDSEGWVREWFLSAYVMHIWHCLKHTPLKAL